MPKKIPEVFKLARGGYARVTEVAIYLGLSRPTVYRLIERRVLPHTTIGGTVRIPRDSVHALLKKTTVLAEN